MPKFTLDANEIVDPNVNLVAIVKRGANRIPFRITKSEEDTTDMIDLAKLGRSMFMKSAALTGPAVAAVMIAKCDDVRMEKIVKTLTEAGIPLDKLTKSDGTGQVNFAKADIDKVEASETFILKMSDDIAVVIQGETELMKSISTYDWESTSFSEIMQKGSFMPSLCVAQDMLSRTFYNILEKAESPADLAKLMKSATDEFNTYVVTLAKGLPSAVFKADLALRKEEIASSPVYGNSPVADARTKDQGGQVDNDIDGKPAVGNATPTQSGTKVDLQLQSPSNNVEGDPAAGAAKGQSTIEKGEGDKTKAAKKKPEDEKKEVKKDEEKPDPVMAAIEALSKSLVDRLDKVTTDFDTKLGGITKTVENVVGEVKKMDEALSGTTGASAEGDKTGIQKSDNTNTRKAPPLLDTGYQRDDDPEALAETVRGGRARHAA